MWTYSVRASMGCTRVVHGSILCDPIQLNRQLTDPTQPNPKFWTQPDPTQYNGAYSLVVTYFYAQNSQSRTFSQPSINLFMLFTDRALNALTQSFQIFSTFAIVDPSQTNPPSTQPDQTQPNPWVNTTHGQLWGAH